MPFTPKRVIEKIVTRKVKKVVSGESFAVVGLEEFGISGIHPKSEYATSVFGMQLNLTPQDIQLFEQRQEAKIISEIASDLNDRLFS